MIKKLKPTLTLILSIFLIPFLSQDTWRKSNSPSANPMIRPVYVDKNIGTRSYGSVTSDKTGNLYSVWVKAVNGNLSLMFSRANKSTDSLGKSIVLSSGSSPSEPVIAVSEDGLIVTVAWVENGIAFNLLTGRVTGSNHNEIVWESKKQVNDLPGLVKSPGLKITANNVYVTWLNEYQGKKALCFDKAESDSFIFGKDVIVRESEDGGFLSPAVSISEDKLFITYIDEKMNGVFLIHSPLAGTNFSLPVPISDSPVSVPGTTFNFVSSSVAGGRIYIAWELTVSGMSAIYFDSAETANLVFGRDKVVKSGRENFHQPVVMANQNCSVVVAYETEFDDFDKRIFISRSNDCGESFLFYQVDTKIVNTLIQKSPSILLDAASKISLLWEESDFNEKNLVYSANTPLLVKAELDPENRDKILVTWTGVDDAVYHIYRIESDDESEISQITSVPTSLRILTDDQGVHIQWTPPTAQSEISGYRVYRSDDSGKTFGFLSDVALNKYTDKGEVSAIAGGSSPLYKVSVLSDKGESLTSSFIKSTPLHLTLGYGNTPLGSEPPNISTVFYAESNSPEYVDTIDRKKRDAKVLRYRISVVDAVAGEGPLSSEVVVVINKKNISITDIFYNPAVRTIEVTLSDLVKFQNIQGDSSSIDLSGFILIDDNGMTISFEGAEILSGTDQAGNIGFIKVKLTEAQAEMIRFMKNPKLKILANIGLVDSKGEDISGERGLVSETPVENDKGFYVVDSGNGEIKISWRAAVEKKGVQFGSYDIYQDNTLVAVLTERVASSYSIKEADLIDGKAHNYGLKVKSLSGEILADYSTLTYGKSVVSTGDRVAPTSPGVLSAREVTEGYGGAIDLTWNRANEYDFKEYRVYRGATSDFAPEGDQPGSGNLIAVVNNPDENRQTVSYTGGATESGLNNFNNQNENSSLIKEDEIIVKFSANATDDVINLTIDKYGLVFKDEIDRIEKEIEEAQNTNPLFIKGEENNSRGNEDYIGLRKKLNIYHFTIPKAVDVFNLLRVLNEEPSVESAEPVSSVTSLTITPDDPEFVNQWAAGKITLPEAWLTQMDSPDVKIAILDTGIATGHPDLISNIYNNPDEIPDDGIDNDGNGYIDDVNGWNFIGINPDITDDLGHGTLVAGVAAATGNNALGVSGVTWKAQLMAVKILNNQGKGVTTDIARGIIYAVDNGANVINISSGTPINSLAIASAVDYAWQKGVIIIASAGNNNANELLYPAALSKVISVSSTDKNDKRSLFSNYGNMTISAPGTGILSTSGTSGYSEASGTSLSAGFVSGAVALLLQNHGINPALQNSSPLTPYQIIKMVTGSVDDLGETGWDNQFGYGRLNVRNLLVANVPANKNPVEGEVLTSPTNIFSSVPHVIGNPIPDIQKNRISYIDSGLKPGTYHYKVVAVDHEGNMAQSETGLNGGGGVQGSGGEIGSSEGITIGEVKMAAAPTGSSAVIKNSTLTTVDIEITGNHFAGFASSLSTTANTTDLSKITYNGQNPISASITAVTKITAIFDISMGTGKSGGDLTIIAGTILDSLIVSPTSNDLITITNTTITDSAVPVVTSVASSKADGSYKAGVLIPITLNFSEPLSSSGLTISLNSGGSVTTDALSSASSRTGNYTVVSGENSSDLTVSSITGTISDSAGNNTVNPAPVTNLAAVKAIVIDTTSPTVTSVTSSKADGSYKAGEVISITLNFSEPLSSSGLTISLNSGGSLTTGALSGASSWTDNYTVVSGENSSDLTVSSITGTINDLAGNNSVNPVPVINLASGRAIVIDTTSPTVTSVTSSKADGSYKAGVVIPITLNFSEPLSSSSITITLNSGATGTFIVSGSSWSSDYTVAAGENSSDLTVSSITGTISDVAGNITVNPVPVTNLALGKAIVIDTTNPTVTAVTSFKADGSYKAGVVIPITLNFSEPLLSVGITAIILNSGGSVTTGTLSVDGLSWTGNYIVVSGENSSDLTVSSITGTINDLAGNNVVNPVSAINLASGRAIVIDTINPTVTSVTSSKADGSYKAGDVIPITLNFGESLLAGITTITLNSGGSVTTGTLSVDGLSWSGNYTVASGENSLDLNIASISGMSDLADNSVDLPVTNLALIRAIIIDTTNPTVTSVTSTKADGLYKAGVVIPITLNFSEPLLSAGITTITFNSGGSVTSGTLSVDGLSWTGNYTVVSGENSSDLTVSSITGTISDLAGNNVVNPVPVINLGTGRAIVIDTINPTVTSVTSTKANGSYKTGVVIPITLNFSEPLLSAGITTITLNSGGSVTSGTLSVDGLSWTGNYTVASGENSPDLTVSSVTGTISDLAGNNTLNPVPVINLASGRAIEIDTINPTVTSVTSSKVDGSYKAGVVIPIKLNFSESLLSAGITTITLNSGGSVTTGTLSVDGLSWTGNYTVATGENSSDLTVNSITGSISDVAGNSAVAPVPTTNLAATKAIVVDTINPTVTSVTSTREDGSYKAGVVIPITLNFSEPLLSAGITTITLNSGGSVTSGTLSVDGLSWTGNYTVGIGENSSDLTVSSITGTINDVAGNSTVTPVPTTNLAAIKAIVVDTINPTVTSVTSSKADGSYKAGVVIPITLNFSEPLLSAGITTITLNSGGSVTSGTLSVDGLSWIGNYTVATGENSSDLTVSSIAGTISDLAGNNTVNPVPVINLASGSAIVIDTINPTVTSVTSSKADGSYKAGVVIPITLNFSEPLLSASITIIKLDSGGSVTTGTLSADKLSWTGNYTVASGENSSDLTVNSITGSISDLAGNSTVTPVPTTNLAAIKAIVVDTINPTVTSVTSTREDGSYKAGVVIPITLNFSEPLLSAGITTITLNSGGSVTSGTLSVDGLSWTGNYIVVSGENSFDLTVSSITGTINDVAGNSTVTPVPTTNLAETKAIVVDTINPTVTSVTSSKADGSYKDGVVIPITLNFSEPLLSAGITTITLNSGGSVTSGTLSVDGLSWTGNYTVALLENSSDLSVNSISGSISDQASNNVVNPAPVINLASGSAIVVDTIKPVVSASCLSVSGNTGISSSFKKGDTLAAKWNNNNLGAGCTDNNNDVVSAVFNLSNFNLTATSVSGVQSGNVWTTIAAQSLDPQEDINNTFSVTVTDNAGNITSVESATGYAVDTIVPVVLGLTYTKNDGSSFPLNRSGQFRSGKETIRIRAAFSESVDTSKVTIRVVNSSGKLGTLSSSTAPYTGQVNAAPMTGSGKEWVLEYVAGSATNEIPPKFLDGDVRIWIEAFDPSGNGSINPDVVPTIFNDGGDKTVANNYDKTSEIISLVIASKAPFILSKDTATAVNPDGDPDGDKLIWISDLNPGDPGKSFKLFIVFSDFDSNLFGDGESITGAGLNPVITLSNGVTSVKPADINWKETIHLNSGHDYRLLIATMNSFDSSVSDVRKLKLSVSGIKDIDGNILYEEVNEKNSNLVIINPAVPQSFEGFDKPGDTGGVMTAKWDWGSEQRPSTLSGYNLYKVVNSNTNTSGIISLKSSALIKGKAGGSPEDKFPPILTSVRGNTESNMVTVTFSEPVYRNIKGEEKDGALTVSDFTFKNPVGMEKTISEVVHSAGSASVTLYMVDALTKEDFVNNGSKIVVSKVYDAANPKNNGDGNVAENLSAFITDALSPKISSILGHIGSDTLKVMFSEPVYKNKNQKDALDGGSFVLTGSENSIVSVSHVAGSSNAEIKLTHPMKEGDFIWEGSVLAIGKEMNITPADNGFYDSSDNSPDNKSRGVTEKSDIEAALLSIKVAVGLIPKMQIKNFNQMVVSPVIHGKLAYQRVEFQEINRGIVVADSSVLLLKSYKLMDTGTSSNLLAENAGKVELALGAASLKTDMAGLTDHAKSVIILRSRVDISDDFFVESISLLQTDVVTANNTPTSPITNYTISKSVNVTDQNNLELPVTPVNVVNVNPDDGSFADGGSFSSSKGETVNVVTNLAPYRIGDRIKFELYGSDTEFGVPLKFTDELIASRSHETWHEWAQFDISDLKPGVYRIDCFLNNMSIPNYSGFVKVIN